MFKCVFLCNRKFIWILNLVLNIIVIKKILEGGVVNVLLDEKKFLGLVFIRLLGVKIFKL